MQIPIDVEVIAKIMPHERLTRVLRVEKLVKEGDHLLLITSVRRGRV
jgi:hypothetical protein